MAASEMIKTKIEGVYQRVNPSKPLFKGNPDVAFYITYKKEGRKVWEKVGYISKGASLKLASQVRRERLHAILHGETLPKEKLKIPKFSEMAKLYLKWSEENKTDSRNDKSRYDNHLENGLGKKRLNEISSFGLERLKSELNKKGLAAATVKHCLVLVREIYNKAIEWGKFNGPNPIKGVKMPTVNNNRERFLTYEEADLLLKKLKEVSTKEKRTHDIALLSLHCGLRFGEIANLKGQDINLETGTIRVMDPKNHTARSAYMTDAVKAILQKRMPEDPGELIFKDRWHGDEIKEVSRTFEKAVNALGFNRGIEDRRNKVVFHTLRHTFGSWLAIQGTPILTIKDLMGHKTLAMTERYAHLTPDVKKEATRALESHFNESRKETVVPFEKINA